VFLRSARNEFPVTKQVSFFSSLTSNTTENTHENTTEGEENTRDNETRKVEITLEDPSGGQVVVRAYRDAATAFFGTESWKVKCTKTGTFTLAISGSGTSKKTVHHANDDTTVEDFLGLVFSNFTASGYDSHGRAKTIGNLSDTFELEDNTPRKDITLEDSNGTDVVVRAYKDAVTSTWKVKCTKPGQIFRLKISGSGTSKKTVDGASDDTTVEGFLGLVFSHFTASEYNSDDLAREIGRLSTPFALRGKERRIEITFDSSGGQVEVHAYRDAVTKHWKARCTKRGSFNLNSGYGTSKMAVVTGDATRVDTLLRQVFKDFEAHESSYVSDGRAKTIGELDRDTFTLDETRLGLVSVWCSRNRSLVFAVSAVGIGIGTAVLCYRKFCRKTVDTQKEKKNKRCPWWCCCCCCCCCPCR